MSRKRPRLSTTAAFDAGRSARGGVSVEYVTKGLDEHAPNVSPIAAALAAPTARARRVSMSARQCASHVPAVAPLTAGSGHAALSGLYENFCPATDASYMAPPFMIVNTAMPL